MKRTVWSVVVAVLLAVTAFGFANAQGHAQRGPRPDFGGPGFGRGGPGGFARFADLTDEQKKQVQAIFEEERASRQGPPASMTLRRQLDAEILSDSPDDQKIDSLRQQLVQAHGEELSRQIALQQRIAQVLTAEQRATARQRLDNRRSGDHERINRR
jgi:Spy/CpxP family protein refolding chaperone